MKGQRITGYPLPKTSDCIDWVERSSAKNWILAKGLRLHCPIIQCQLSVYSVQSDMLLKTLSLLSKQKGDQ